MQTHCIRAGIDDQVNVADFDCERDPTIVWLWDNLEAFLSKLQQTEYNTLS